MLRNPEYLSFFIPGLALFYPGYVYLQYKTRLVIASLERATNNLHSLTRIGELSDPNLASIKTGLTLVMLGLQYFCTEPLFFMNYYGAH